LIPTPPTALFLPQYSLERVRPISTKLRKHNEGGARGMYHEASQIAETLS